MRVVSVLLILSVLFCFPAAAAEPPSQRELELELQAVSIERQKLFSDYKLGEQMMELAKLKDAPLKAREERLKAALEALKTQPQSAPKPADK